MSVSIVLDKKQSCHGMAIFSGCVLGLLAPLAAWAGWYFGLDALQHGGELPRALLGILLFGIIWPFMGIMACTIFALNPLFGKTHLCIDAERMEVRKTLFGCCWLHHCYPNDEQTFLTLACQTQQSPAFKSHATSMNREIPATTTYRIFIRRGKLRCCLHESQEETEEQQIFDRLLQARQSR